MPLGKTANPLLQQTEQAIQAKVPPQYQAMFQKVVTAGLTLIYSSALHQRMVTALQTATNPEQNAAQGAANIIGLVFNQAKGQVPMQVVAPAAIVIMCEILDFVAQVGKLQISPQLVAQCTQDTGAAVLKMLKISQAQMHQVVAKGLAHRDSQQAAPQAAPPTPAPQSGGIIGNAMQGAQ